MGKYVKGIHQAYFDDIIDDYRNEREKSFLYRSFWAESVKGLLRESLPPLPKKNELKKQMEELYGGFLELLADEGKGPEQMKEHYVRLPKEVKELLRVHLPQLPERVAALLKEHSRQLPEEIMKLLDRRFPWLLEEEAEWPNHGAKIRELLKENILERPEWARNALTRKPPQWTENGQEPGAERQKKERRNFWDELMLNDAGYQAGLITDTEYYLWLTEYLAARDIYYKDASMADGHIWLYELLRKGLGREPEESLKLDGIRKLEKEIHRLELEIAGLDEHRKHESSGNPETHKKAEKLRELIVSRKLGKITELEKLKEAGESGNPAALRMGGGQIRDKAGVGRDLAELAEKLRHEAETGETEISNRLHGLKCTIKNKKGQVKKADYLPWLTRRLEKMAIHIKVKTWLQDNGRKQDFSMHLFEAYCDSGQGYDFIPKKEGGKEADKGWAVRNGFCVWMPEGFLDSLQTLLQALKQDGREDFYLPLAMDLRSGCVFFLAGKGYYTKVYEKSKDKKLQDNYEKVNAFYCYDYLRLDKVEDSEDPEAAFRLSPAFHKNAGESYVDILREFKLYCEGVRDRQVEAQVIDGEEGYFRENVNDVPRLKIKAYNEEWAIGIPKALRWAFDSQEDSEPSPRAKSDFKRVQNEIQKRLI